MSTLITENLIEDLTTNLEKLPARSAWSKGVKEYTDDFIASLKDNHLDETVEANDFKSWEKLLLNGAFDWSQYSYGACSLVYDQDIAERLCTPSELKRSRNGELQPNSRETWLDVQARALYQAMRQFYRLISKYQRKDV